jgi:hypothetical protein
MRHPIKFSLVPLLLVLIVTLVALACFAQVTAPEPREDSSTATTLDSKEMAALLLAYEDYRDRLKESGIALTPAEFARRHRSVRVRRRGVEIDVYFYPDTELTAGGDVSYLVNANELKITERFFGR